MHRATILICVLASMLLATLASAQTETQAPSSDLPPQNAPITQDQPPSEPREHRHDHEHGGSGVGVGVSVDLGSLLGGGSNDEEGDDDGNVYVGKPDFVAHDPERRLGALGRTTGETSIIVSRDGHDYLRQYYYVETAKGPDWYYFDTRLEEDDPALKGLVYVPQCPRDSDDCGEHNVLCDNNPINCGNGPGAPVLADKKPTAVPGDPEGGIDVPGGKAHRGTGEYTNPNNPKDKRAAFYLWVDFKPDDSCKACAWYQFLKIELSLDGTDVTKGAAKGGSIPSSIGGFTTPGQWGGDWHKKDEEKAKGKKKPHIKMPGEKSKPEGGAYAPMPIPGVDGAEGLVDAPNWGLTGGIDQLYPRLFHLHGTGRNPPADEEHTLVITSHFRDFLYCTDPVKCLGYSEETYVETIKFKLTWVAASKVSIDSMEPSWDAQFTVTDDTSTVSFDGKWKDCP